MAANWAWVYVANLRGPQGIPGPTGPNWVKNAIAASTDLNTLTTAGAYWITTFANASTMTPALPLLGSGAFEVLTVGTNIIQRWTTTGASPNGAYQREYTGAAWTAWRRVDEPVVPWAKVGNSGALAYKTAASGTYYVFTAQNAVDAGLPVAAGGVVEVFNITATAALVRYSTFATPQQVWQQELNGSTWTAWHRTDAGAIAVPKENGPGSGFKVLPLCVTVPSTGSKNVATARQERHMMCWAAPITRWKIHVRNFDYRLNTALTGTVTLTGVYFGEHDMTTTPTYAFKASPAPSLIASGVTMVDGAEWVSPWINKPLEADKEYLLSLGFTGASGQEFYIQVGSVGADASNGNAGNVAAPSGTGAATLDVWIEAETYATTPSFAVLDDSTGSGVGATYKLRDSWPTKYAKARKALPVHYTASGDSYNAYTNTSWGKWTRWQGLDKPDALIAALGNNDIFQGASLATLQGWVNTVIPAMKAITSNNFYWGTVFPRTTLTGATETVRRDFNTWMRTLPHGARDCFELAAAISLDDETINPAYDADGVHLNSAGDAAVAAAITRPVTTPPVQYVTLP